MIFSFCSVALLLTIFLLSIGLFWLNANLGNSTYAQRQNTRNLKRWIRGIKRQGEDIFFPFAFGLLILTIVALATINLG